MIPVWLFIFVSLTLYVMGAVLGYGEGRRKR